MKVGLQIKEAKNMIKIFWIIIVVIETQFSIDFLCNCSEAKI